jgi:hypothetical protein
MVMTHQSVVGFCTRFAEQLRRNVYVTPKNYLDFIANYQSSLTANRQTIGEMSERLNGGLSKLIQVPNGMLDNENILSTCPMECLTMRIFSPRAQWNA